MVYNNLSGYFHRRISFEYQKFMLFLYKKFQLREIYNSILCYENTISLSNFLKQIFKLYKLKLLIIFSYQNVGKQFIQLFKIFSKIFFLL